MVPLPIVLLTILTAYSITSNLNLHDLSYMQLFFSEIFLKLHNQLTCKAAAVGTASSLLGLLGHGAPVGAAHSANPFLWFPLRFPLSNLDWAGIDSPPGCPATILGHFDCFGPIFAYFDDCI